MKKPPINRPRLQIIRGLPGSGKSTLALEKFPSLMRVETDMYFTRRGRYIFTKELNKKAVPWFHIMTAGLIAQEMDFVLTGVFAAHTERLERVVKLALASGYEVYIKTLTNNYGNIHNVPASHYYAMKRDFVADKNLKTLLPNDRHLHFGLMDTEIKIGERKRKYQSAAEVLAALCDDPSLVGEVKKEVRKEQSKCKK